MIHIWAPANQARTAPDAPRASTGKASGTTQQAAQPRTAPVVATMEPTPTAFWFGSLLAGSAFNGAPGLRDVMIGSIHRFETGSGDPQDSNSAPRADPMDAL